MTTDSKAEVLAHRIDEPTGPTMRWPGSEASTAPLCDSRLVVGWLACASPLMTLLLLSLEMHERDRLSNVFGLSAATRSVVSC